MGRILIGGLLVLATLGFLQWLAVRNIQEVGVEGVFTPQELITQSKRTRGRSVGAVPP